MCTVNFTLKLIDKSFDKYLNDFLEIYSKNININIRTDTNDIIYWIDNYNTLSKISSLYVFGLFLNEKPIGYCQIVYFHDMKMIFIDYIAITKEYRGVSFNAFISLIKQYFENKKIVILLYVTEVPYYSNSLIPSTESEKLSYFLKKKLGMKSIKALYYQPELGLSNEDTQMMATLLIKFECEEPHMDTIGKKVYLNILYTIYEKHYLFWYKSLMTNNEYSIYKEKIRIITKSIERSLENIDILELNGLSNSSIIYPIPKQEGKWKNNIKLILAIIFSFLVSFLIIFALVKIISSFFEFDIGNSIGIISSAGTSALFIFGLWRLRNEDINQIIEKILN